MGSMKEKVATAWGYFLQSLCLKEWQEKDQGNAETDPDI